MRERLNPVLKIVCVLLAGLVLYQIASWVAHKDPLANFNIAALSLPAATTTNAQSKVTRAVSTNAILVSPNMISSNVVRTRAVSTNGNSTNALSLNAGSTNGVRTNAVSTVTARASRASAIPVRDAGMKQADLPPAVQARVDKITQSEILGAVVRPLPMALLGIAGKDVFLRAPNGQTGLIREGEELGGVKLIRVGMNRVLIELEQQQQELTLFSGFGSETLLPKGEKSPRETIIQSPRSVQP
jgi:hypothetical protein